MPSIGGPGTIRSYLLADKAKLITLHYTFVQKIPKKQEKSNLDAVSIVTEWSDYFSDRN